VPAVHAVVALAQAVTGQGGAPTAPPAVTALPETGGYGLFLVETLLILVAICALAYVVLRFGVRRLYGGPAGQGGPVKVLQRVALEPRRALYVIEAAGKTLLVASAESGMTLVSELDADAVARSLAQQPRRASFLDLLTAKRRADAAHREAKAAAAKGEDA
jgi:flagellar biogenesis protein FliO